MLKMSMQMAHDVLFSNPYTNWIKWAICLRQCLKFKHIQFRILYLININILVYYNIITIPM